MDSKKTGAQLKYASQSWIRQGSGAGTPKRVELASLSLKKNENKKGLG